MSHSFRTALAALTLIAATVPAQARQLSPDEALAAVRGQAPARVKAASAQQMALSYTQPLEGDSTQNAIYVFNRGNDSGFMLVSADDVAPSLIGYADSGSFDPTDIPPALKGWMEQNAKVMRYAIDNPRCLPLTVADNGRTDGKSRLVRRNIEPLVKAKWNQDMPYNYLCPNYYTGERTVTGCVATAYAQVMKYWQWPRKGNGSYSYVWNNGSTDVTLSADFGNTTYDWANMPDRPSSYTTAQRDALSTLIHHCGVAVDMQYNISSNGGSGAVSANVERALIKYFDYDPSTTHYNRDHFTGSEWNELLYNEMAAARPVVYHGQGSAGGHCFVVDGYEKGDYFHINWGWGGSSDGYFLINVLDPYTLGIGGGGGGFNYSQGAIVGIQPNRGGSHVARIGMEGQFSATTTTVDRTSSYTYFLSNAQPDLIYNASSTENFSGTLGVKLTAADGAVTYIGSYGASGLKPGYGWRRYSVRTNLFPTSGTYTVSPAYKSSSDNIWRDVLTVHDANGSITVNCSASTLEFSAPLTESTLYGFLNLQGTPNADGSYNIYVDTPVTVEGKFTIEGLGYHALITPSILNNGSVTIDYDQMPYLDFNPGFITTHQWTMSFGQNDLTIGNNYPLIAVNVVPTSSGTNVYQASEPTLIRLCAKPSGSASLRADNVKFLENYGALEATLENPAYIFRSSVQIDADITNDGDFGTRTVTAHIFPVDGARAAATADASTDKRVDWHSVSLENGQTRSFHFEGNLEHIEGNKVYGVYLHDGVRRLTDPMYFRSSTTGASDVSVDATDAPAELYDLRGVRVDTDSPAPGVYLERRGHKVTKRVVR